MTATPILDPVILRIPQEMRPDFSIRGNDEQSRSSRMHIYVTLLKQMAPEHLLATFAKICAEILAAASDGLLNIEDKAGQSVFCRMRSTFFLVRRSEFPLAAGQPQNQRTWKKKGQMEEHPQQQREEQ
ncbi:hypothetical protein HAX54_052316 [Datura stramonium]|uniref:Uncharacterized protein n=1 Tax=Datura stramonium TaxID=4076 RepID=A0ABS8SYT5_DATST|nr:hypothetical protein [Datura stramonium]